MISMDVVVELGRQLSNTQPFTHSSVMGGGFKKKCKNLKAD